MSWPWLIAGAAGFMVCALVIAATRLAVRKRRTPPPARPALPLHRILQ